MARLVRLPAPHHGNYVWRYMPLHRFDELLATGMLHFTNALALSDQYEVTVPRASLFRMRRTSQGDPVASREYRAWLTRTKSLRRSTWVSCWSTQRYESYALWKIYLGGKKEGVAIRTTFARLQHAIRAGSPARTHHIQFGSVQYTTYLSDPLPTPEQLVCTKKPFYEFEKELRAFVVGPEHGQHDGPYPNGLAIPVQLDLLLDAVVASPFAHPRFIDRVFQRLGRARIDMAVLQSQVMDR